MLPIQLPPVVLGPSARPRPSTSKCLVSRSSLAPSPSDAPKLQRDEGAQQRVDSSSPEARTSSKPRRVSRRNAAGRQQQHQPQQQGEGDQPLQPVNAPSSINDAHAIQRDNQLLEARLRAATSRTEAIHYVLEEHPSPLQPAQLVFVCSHLAKMCDPQAMTHKNWVEMQVAFNRLLNTYPDHVNHMSAYELVVILTSLARAHVTPSTDWLESYLAASTPHLPSFGPGYIYLLLRALSRVNLQLWELKRAPSFRPWMHKLLAVAQAKVWAYRGDELVKTLSVLSALKWQPSPEWAQAFSTAIRKRLEFLDPPLLSQALMALSAQRSQPEPGLMQAMFTQLTTKLPMFDDRDLASAAQAVGLVKRVSNGDFFADFMVEVGQKSGSFTTASVAHLLHALSTLVTNGGMAVLSRAHIQASDQQALMQQQQIQQQDFDISTGNFEDVPTLDEALDTRPARLDLLSTSASDEEDEDSVKATAAPSLLSTSAAGMLSPAPSRRPRLFGDIAPPSADSNGTLTAAPLFAPHAPPPRRRPTLHPSIDALQLRPMYPDPIAAQQAAIAAAAAARASSPASSSRGDGNGTGNGAPQVIPRSWRALPAASPAWLRAMSARVYDCLPHMSVTHAGMALRGLTLLGHQLDPHRLDVFFVASLPDLKTGRTDSFVYLVQALAGSNYQPYDAESAANFRAWFDEYCRLACKRTFTPALVCDMVSGLAGLPLAPPPRVLATVLQHSRRDRPSALKHAAPRKLARLGSALRALRYIPDFGFIHSYAQAVRFHWSGIKPPELTAVMCGLAAMCPNALAVDHLWMSEVLLMVQCRLDKFESGGSLAALLSAVVSLSSDPGRWGPTGCGAPSEKWCEAVFCRLEELTRTITPPHAASILWSAASVAQHRANPARRGHMYNTQPSEAPSPACEFATFLSPDFMSWLVSCVSDSAHRLPDGQVQDVAWAVQVLGHKLPSPLAAAARQATERQRPQQQQAFASPDAQMQGNSSPNVVRGWSARTSPEPSAATTSTNTQVLSHVLESELGAVHAVDLPANGNSCHALVNGETNAATALTRTLPHSSTRPLMDDDDRVAADSYQIMDRHTSSVTMGPSAPAVAFHSRGSAMVLGPAGAMEGQVLGSINSGDDEEDRPWVVPVNGDHLPTAAVQGAGMMGAARRLAPTTHRPLSVPA